MRKGCSSGAEQIKEWNSPDSSSGGGDSSKFPKFPVDRPSLFSLSCERQFNQPTKSMAKIVPLISSGVAGPLGVLHLPRLWLKCSLEARGKLADGYPGIGKGATAVKEKEGRAAVAAVPATSAALELSAYPVETAEPAAQPAS